MIAVIWLTQNDARDRRFSRPRRARDFLREAARQDVAGSVYFLHMRPGLVQAEHHQLSRGKLVLRYRAQHRRGTPATKIWGGK